MSTLSLRSACRTHMWMVITVLVIIAIFTIIVVAMCCRTSDEHISIAQFLKASNVDGAIIVTTPQEVSIIDVRKEINFCKKVQAACGSSRSSIAHSPLPVAHGLLPVTLCPLRITHCLMPIAYCLLPIVCCLL